MASDNIEPTIYPVDLNGATHEDYLEMASLIEEKLGRLDGVLHNAGELGPRKSLKDYDVDAWNRVLQINVTAAFLMNRALIPILEQSPNGRILLTSSGVGYVGRAHWGAYSVSKFATEGMMQVLADDLDGISNICVNAINPGATRTHMRASAFPAENPANVKSSESLMPLYLFLMGPDSRELNGQSIDA